jgi:hypothetical protein
VSISKFGETLMKKNIFLICLSLFIFNCSKQPLGKYKQAHQDYLSKVRVAKEQSSKKDYQEFLSTQIQKKEMELTNLKTIKGGAQQRHSQSESQQSQQEGDINYFRANTARVELHQIDSRMKFIEKELFFLKSQLSSLE